MGRRKKRPDVEDPVPYTYRRGKRWYYQRRSKRIPGGRLDLSLGINVSAPLNRVRSMADAITRVVDGGQRDIVAALANGTITVPELLAAQEEARLHDLQMRAPGPVHLGSTVDAWLALKKSEVDKSTYAGLKGDMTRLLDHLPRDCDMVELTPDGAAEILRGPQPHLPGNAPWAPGTQRRKRATYRMIWAYAIDRDRRRARRTGGPRRFDENPWVKAKPSTVKGRNHAARAVLSIDEVRLLLKEARKQSLKRFVWTVLIFVLGCRNTEARRLRRSDIIEVEDGFFVRIRTIKGGVDRELEWPWVCNPALEKFLANGAGEVYLLESRDKRGGRMHGPDAPRYWLKDLCAATGIPYGRADGIVVHSGRHTLATELLMENVTSTKVARILGNTPAVVDETYDHLMPSDVRRDHAQIMDRKLGDLTEI